MEDISITSVGVTILPGKQGSQMKNPGDVTFIVKYSDDYKGPRHMPEGPVVISKESADEFVKRGIGSIEVKEEVKTEEEVKNEKPAPSPVLNYEKMNKGKLQEVCTERGLEFDDTNTRQDLIDMLIENDNKEKQQ